MMRKSIFIVCVFTLNGCSSIIPQPTEYDVQQTNGTVSLQSLKLGRDMYIAHCSGCHSLHAPNEYHADEWRKVFPEMQKKAKLSNEQKTAMLKYITFYSKK